MRLTPFKQMYAPRVQEWQNDPSYAKFFRGIDRYLTLDECAHIGEVLRAEVLMILDKDIVGMISIKRDPFSVAWYSTLIDKGFQKNGMGTEATRLMEEYLFKTGNIRKIMTYTTSELHNVLSETLGYEIEGELKNQVYVNGAYENLTIFSKMR